MDKFKLVNLGSTIVELLNNPEFCEECIKVASAFTSQIIPIGLLCINSRTYAACIFVECTAQGKVIVGMNKNSMYNLYKNITGLINAIKDLELFGVKTYLSNSILNTNGDVILESALTALGWKKLYQKCTDSLPEVYLYTRECNEICIDASLFDHICVNQRMLLNDIFSSNIAIAKIDRSRSIITVSVNDQCMNISLLKCRIKDILLQEFGVEADYPMIFRTEILTGIFDKEKDADFYQFESIK